MFISAAEAPVLLEETDGSNPVSSSTESISLVHSGAAPGVLCVVLPGGADGFQPEPECDRYR
jgi:hypothetical protein